VNGSELMAVVMFGLAVLGAVAGAWWRVESAVAKAKSEALLASTTAALRADLAHTALAEHKLHVAEAYVSKQGLREQMEPLFDAVKDVSGQVRHLSERLDRVFEAPRAQRKTTP
jgi:hypothetical protein